MPWPNHDLNPDNHDLSVADFVFPVGFGLTPEGTLEWVALNEQAVGQKQSLDEWVFDKSVRVGPRGAVSGRRELSLSVVDREVQEDERRVEFSGNDKHLRQVYFQFEDPVNMRPLEVAGGALSFDIRLLKKPTEQVLLRMDCDYPYSGQMDITSILSAAALSDWQKLAFPLECFAQLGVDSSNVNTPFLLATKGELVFEISEVVLAETPASANVMSCGKFLADA